MACDRLREAGIAALPQGDHSAESRDLGPYGVYVEDRDIERAREILSQAPMSEAELIAAVEEHAAARGVRLSADSTGEPDKSINTPTPKRTFWQRVTKRAARSKDAFGNRTEG
jgi:hypothetical protein